MKSDAPAASVGSCRLRERLASGGFGTVYRGFDPHLNVERAVKVIHPHVIAQKGFRERFQTELRLSAGLDHPNIVRLLYAVDEPTVCGYVMEFVPGMTLRRRLREAGRLPPAEALDVVLQAARAVQYSQSLRPPIIHRDLTPENVMIRPDGVVKVMDYGIAAAMQDPALSVSKMIVGKPKYMPPEQFEGEVTTGADLYALGIILYECLTGTPPFEGASPMSIYRAHVLQVPKRPSEVLPGLPPALDALVLRSLAKDPARRWPDAASMAQALEYATEVIAGSASSPPALLEPLFRIDADGPASRQTGPEEQVLVEEQYERGVGFLANQRYADAAEAFDAALRIDPAHFESRRNRRVARLRQLEVSETRADRSRLADIEDGAMRHAQTLYSERRWEEAAAAFERVLMINPDRLDARRYRYEAQEKSANESEEARRNHERALSALVRATAALEAGRLEEAAAAAVEALSAEPGNPMARDLAARAGAARIEAASRSATVTPRAGDPAGVTKLREGLAQFIAGAFEEAAGALAEAASLLPLDTVAPRFLARCRARLSEASEAKAEISKLDAREEEKTAPATYASPPRFPDRLQPGEGTLPVITPEDLGSLDMERQALVPAVRPSAAAPPLRPPTQPPAATSSALPFVGRANTLQAMDRALDEIPRGRGGFLLVRGQPGVGKTRLLDEFIRRHSYRNAVFLRATCSGDLGDYFAPWKDLAWDALKSVEETGMQAFVRLSMRFAHEFGRFGERFRRLAQSHGRDFDTTASDERVRALLVDLFAGVLEHRSLVVVLDALESADSETLAVLELLAALAKDRPLILLGAASQSRAADTNPWVRSYGSLRSRKLAQEFLVPRLPEDEVRRLLGPLFGRELGRPPDLETPRADARIAGEVSRASEGNLHQLEKICRHLARTGLVAEDEGLWKLTKRGPLTEEDLVAGLADALFSRYRALTSRQSAVLRWLSLSEDGVPFDSLAEVTGLGQAELFHAVHELAAQKLCTETDDRGRKIPSIPSPLLRQKIAEEIPPSERPGLHDRLAATLDRLERSAPDRAAAQALLGSNADRAVDTCFRAADAALGAAHPADARAWLDRAEPWLARARGKGLVPAHAERMGRALLAAGAPDAALRSFQAVLAASPAAERSPTLRLDLARCHLLLGKRREAADAAALALERARDRRDEVGCSLFLSRLALLNGDTARAGDLLESVRPHAEACGLAGPALAALAAYRYSCGDAGQAEADAEEALQRGGAPEAHLILARCRMHAGKALTAAARLENALESCGDHVLEAEILALLATARAAGGRLPAARGHAATALARAKQSAAPAAEARAELAAAKVALAARDGDTALAAAARAQALFDSLGLKSGLACAHITLVEACIARGEVQRALGYADLAAAGAGSPELAGRLAVARAEAIARSGRGAEARHAFHDALKLLGARWKDSALIARSFAGLASIHATNGDRDKAAENVARALRALRDSELILATARVRVFGAALATGGPAAMEAANAALEAAGVLEQAGCAVEAAAAHELAARLGHPKG